MQSQLKSPTTSETFSYAIQLSYDDKITAILSQSRPGGSDHILVILPMSFLDLLCNF